MASPADEIDQPKYPVFNTNNGQNSLRERSSDEEGTVVDSAAEERNTHHLHVNTATGDKPPDSELGASPSKNREQSHRLDDDLRMLQVERQVSQAAEERISKEGDNSTVRKERSRREPVVDEFDVATNPIHQRAAIYKPPEHPENRFAKFMKRVHKSSFLVRYFTYIVPVVVVILIPLLIGGLVHFGKTPSVGGVQLMWFCIWLEVVWLTLWAGRIVAKGLPWPMGLISSLFTSNTKTWRDMAKQLELPATLFFWMLAVEISFLPIMRNHQVDGNDGTDHGWQKNMNKVLVTFLVLAALNFAEKICIQLIAISFHERTYSDRIELVEFQISSLTKLYQYSKVKIAMQDSDFEAPSGGGPGSGARTPGQYIEEAQKGTVKAFNKFGDVAGKIAGDFTGRDIKQSDHPSQVVRNLLSSNSGSQVLARRLYRTFGREETSTVFQEDLVHAFETEDEAQDAFSMFDKDMNGDISMEELEAVCVEIGRERKSITAALKDLDSVVSKLNNVLVFLVVVISILILIALLVDSASGFFTTIGTSVLGISWLFSVTAQEFLQSIVFVFIKHPFDVGDRVTIYGNTGTKLTGDDYFVKEIALLYTEFKKMEGQIVQAPNSYLNTLFILNQRRSGGCAEALPLIFKFGTSLDQIEGLRTKLLEFVKAEKREYQPNILTELREITEAHSITVNIVFFFKSNWQNELLRLQRRNKFICALMVCMQELGIEGPRMRYPGMRESFPAYLQNVPFDPRMTGRGGNPDHPDGQPLPATDDRSLPRSTDETTNVRSDPPRSPSIVRTRRRGESLAQMGRRMDFSLGMSDAISNGDLMGDIHEDRDRENEHEARARSRIPVEESEPATHAYRNSRDRSDSTTSSLSRPTLGAGALRHRRTEPTKPRPSGSVHRNRFFGRVSHDTERMESGMAGIPENGTVGADGTKDERMDSRSGLVNPKAVRTNTNETVGFPPYGRDVSEAQDFELQRLRPSEEGGSRAVSK